MGWGGIRIKLLAISCQFILDVLLDVNLKVDDRCSTPTTPARTDIGRTLATYAYRFR